MSFFQPYDDLNRTVVRLVRRWPLPAAALAAALTGLALWRRPDGLDPWAEIGWFFDFVLNSTIVGAVIVIGGAIWLRIALNRAERRARGDDSDPPAG